MKVLLAVLVIIGLGSFAKASDASIYKCAIQSTGSYPAAYGAISQEILASSQKEAEQTIINALALNELGKKEVKLERIENEINTFTIKSKDRRGLVAAESVNTVSCKLASEK